MEDEIASCNPPGRKDEAERHLGAVGGTVGHADRSARLIWSELAGGVPASKHPETVEVSVEGSLNVRLANKLLTTPPTQLLGGSAVSYSPSAGIRTERWVTEPSDNAATVPVVRDDRKHEP
jgi:hypothetical protein